MKFIELTCLDIDNKSIKRFINTSKILEIVSKPDRKGAYIRFYPESEHEVRHPKSFEAVETYEDVKKAIQK